MLTVLGGAWESPDYQHYNAESFFALPQVHQQIDPDKMEEALMEAAVFFACQEMRNEHALPTYAYNGQLHQAAKLHAEDMEKFGFLDHINKRDKNRRSPMKRVENSGGTFDVVGENLAQVNLYQLGDKGEYFLDENQNAVDKNGRPLQTYTYAELGRRVVENWMNSPLHRQNLMDDFNFMAIGSSRPSTAQSRLPQLYITQNFGKK